MTFISGFKPVRTRNRFCGLCLLLTGLWLTGGCEPASNPDGPSTTGGPSTSGKLRIVTTCGMVTDIVREVAGDRAEVEALMNERVDPHLYKPTRGDLNRLMQADLVFYVGLMLEGRMTDTFAKVGRAGIPVYPVAEGIDESYLLEPEHFAGHYDPHVWMDVSAWSRCAAYVTDVLCERDPEHADEYRGRSAAYRAQLEQLHEYARTSLASIPREQRVLITAHDAFGYFARAYDVEVRALQGISTESEASVDDVNQLVDFIVRRKIAAIFVESSVNREGIEAILQGVASRGHQARIGGELFSDAMGAPGTYAGTYLGMMDHNITTIVRSLGGDAPERGLFGKLSAPEHP